MITIEYTRVEVETITTVIRVTADNEVAAFAKATVGSMAYILKKEGVEQVGDVIVEKHCITRRFLDAIKSETMQ